MTRWLRRALPVAVLLSLQVSPSSAAAQSRADSAAVILATAQRLEAEGRTETAATLLEWILERYGDTPAAARVRALREAGGNAPAGSGDVELQVWGTLYGAWLGVAVPVMAGADSPEPYGAGLLLGAPIGFLTSRIYARSRALSEGQARAITWGGTWGTWHGFALAEITELGATGPDCIEIDVCIEPAGPDPEWVVAAGVGGGLLGIGLGALVSRRPISPGVATAVNFGSLWGTWIGLASGILLDLEGDDLLVSSLAGGDVGLLGSAILANRWRLSRSRARIISIAGVLGGLAGGGIALLTASDSEDGIAIPLAGSLLGLVLGTTFTSDQPSLSAGGGADDQLDAARDNGLRLNIGAALLPTTDRFGQRRLMPGAIVRIRGF